jgi:hypothetical protein
LVSSYAPYRAANNDAYKAGVGSYVSRNAVNAAADDNRKRVKNESQADKNHGAEA